MRLLPLNQQVVVVVGASSGIGRATALCLAAQGASVVVSSRNRKALDSLVDEIRHGGGVAVPVVADAADAEQMKLLADRAVAALGRIDTWAHVAAVSVYATFEQTKPEEFRRVVEVNLLGQVNGAQAALPHLKKNGGALIHVSSIEAKVSVPFNAAYAASKHGVAGFIDALRLELRREGAPVSVTQILPAGINTPLFDHALTRLGVEPRPPAPVYQPELVARAIVYAAEHPVRAYFDAGVAVTLCTDGWLMTGVTLSDEYWLAHTALNFTRPEIDRLILDGFANAFLPWPERQALVARVREELADLV